ncbi:MAG: GTP cyclohydrolase FolE2 [Deltaproteobacteria bacterium]|nr:GTP cyclohydrolase FolE2 [Deltaproteobacteria bacterium]MCL5792665.1 GTP cyclohydrolase FolE2 [Deltaproteobacteria bacterium]
MKDVQNTIDHRGINIDKVGVKNIRYPITVLDKLHEVQHTIASINMYVDLPKQFKGTHMSRFIEILNQYRGNINIKDYPDILDNMQRKFNAHSAHLEIEFPYFIEKKAPMSGAKSLMEYNCRFTGVKNGNGLDFILEVTVPVLTLCPCSKEISKHNAHNQRSFVTVHLRFNGLVWIEEVVKIVEGSASAELFSLLKRADEKYITEYAYEHPMFVEDIVRDVANKLKSNKQITWFSVEAENLESIHNHNVYACVEYK